MTLTRDDGPGWTGERGRISGAMLERAVPNIATHRVHICGPTEMTEPTRKMLHDLGVPEGSIEMESFASPSRAASIDPAALANGKAMRIAMDNEEWEASITFARSNKSTGVTADQTVLEAAEALGVAINYDCRAGICGQCKVKRLAGRVVMETEDALTCRGPCKRHDPKLSGSVHRSGGGGGIIVNLSTTVNETFSLLLGRRRCRIDVSRVLK